MSIRKKLIMSYIIVNIISFILLSPLFIDEYLINETPKVVNVFTFEDPTESRLNISRNDGNFSFINITTWSFSFELDRDLSYFRIDNSIILELFTLRLGYNGSISFYFEYAVKSTSTDNKWVPLPEPSIFHDVSFLPSITSTDLTFLSTIFKSTEPLNSTLFSIGTNYIQINYSIFSNHSKSKTVDPNPYYQGHTFLLRANATQSKINVLEYNIPILPEDRSTRDTNQSFFHIFILVLSANLPISTAALYITQELRKFYKSKKI